MPVTWSDEKLILLYIAPVGDRTHALPHTVDSNMVNVSHALTHSDTEAVETTNKIRMYTHPRTRARKYTHVYYVHKAMHTKVNILQRKSVCIFFIVLKFIMG